MPQKPAEVPEPELDTFGNPIDPSKTYRVIDTDAVGNVREHPYSCICEVCRSVRKRHPDAVTVFTAIPSASMRPLSSVEGLVPIQEDEKGLEPDDPLTWQFLALKQELCGEDSEPHQEDAQGNR